MLRMLIFPSRITVLSRRVVQATGRSFTSSQVDVILSRLEKEIVSMKAVDIFKVMIDAKKLNIRFNKFHTQIHDMIAKEPDEANMMKFILSNLCDMRNIHQDYDYLFVLKTITPRLQNFQLSNHELTEALQSLQGLTVADIPELQLFLQALSKQISACDSVFDTQTVLRSIHSLNALGRDNATVRDLMRQLTTTALPSRSPAAHAHVAVDNLSDSQYQQAPPQSYYMSPDEFSMAIFGLKKLLTPDSTGPVKSLLSTLPHRLCEYEAWTNGSQKQIWTHDKSNITFQPNHLGSNATKLSLWSAHNISHILMGINQMPSSDPTVRMFLRTVVVPALEVCDPSGFSNPLYLRSAVFGLRCMSSDYAEVQTVIRLLSRKIREGSSSIALSPPLLPRDVADICSGLHSLSDDHTETLMLIDSLLPHINRCQQRLSMRQWCKALSGLQHMRSEHAVVRALLRALISKVSTLGMSHEPKHLSTSARVTSPSVGGTLREGECDIDSQLERSSTDATKTGLSDDLDCPPEESAPVLSRYRNIGYMGTDDRGGGNVDNDSISSKDYVDMTTNDISNALYGIVYMQYEQPEVRTVIQYITEGIRNCNTPRLDSTVRGLIEGKALARCLRSLRTMSSKSSDVRALVASLAELLLRSETPVQSLESLHIAHALRGMARLNSYRPEVRQLVREVAKKAHLLHERSSDFNDNGEYVGKEMLWSADLMSNALYGLQGMNSDYDEVATLLQEILPFMETTNRDHTSQPTSLDENLNMSLAQSTLALYGLKNMSTNELLPNSALVNRVLDCIIQRSAQACEHMIAMQQKRPEDIMKEMKRTDATMRNIYSFVLQPKHIASALYGMQRMLEVSVTHGESNKALSLLHSVINAHFLTIDLHNAGVIEDIQIEWEVPKYSGAIYGLLSLDFSGDAMARKFLKWVLSSMRSCEVICPSQSQVADSTSELVKLQKLRLYQFLLMFYAKSYTHSTLPPELESLLYSSVSDIQSSIQLPPVTHLSSHMTTLYKSKIDELLSSGNRGLKDMGLVDMSSMRHIAAFYGVYLHGFLCDIVLVGYYGKWHQTMLNSSRDTASDIYSNKQHRHHHDEYDTGDDGGGSGYYTATPPPVAAVNRWGGCAHSITGFTNTSTQELIDFINSRNSERLVVVNLEIDGTQKDLVEAEGKSEMRDHYLQSMHNVTVRRVKLSEKRKLNPESRLIAEFDSILEID